MPSQDLFARLDSKGNFMGFTDQSGESIFSRSNQIERAIERHRAKHRSGFTRAVGVGDSYMAGNQASTPAASMYGRLKADLGTEFGFLSYGVGGKVMAEYIQQPLVDGVGPASMSIFPTAKDDVFFSVLGLNDLRGSGSACGSSPANMPQLQKKAQALATWLMVPEANKVRMHNATNTGPNPAVTFAGGAWTHTGFGTEPNFSYTFTGGASASFTSTKGDLLIIWIGQDTGGGNVCTVTVDGNQLASWTTISAYDAWSMSCVIVPLPTNGVHQVTLAQVGGGTTMIAGAAVVDTTTDFGATLLYSPPAYLPDGANLGWSLGGGALNGATAQALGGAGPYVLNNAGSDRFAAAMMDGMDQLYALGFNVAYVPARVGFNHVGHIGADNIHPNDVGYEHLYKPFRRVMAKMAGV